MKKELTYYVINLMTGQSWNGKAENAKEAYSHIEISKGDTTIIQYGKLSNVKEW